jgi:hypothetical protein
MKRSLKIADVTPSGGLAFDLIDIVSLLGDRALKSHWTARDVWTVQEGDDGQFEDMCERGVQIPGNQFSNALKKVMQVIDGRFEAFDADSKEPWVIVEAIDSSYFVLRAESDILSQARARFRTVSD